MPGSADYRSLIGKPWVQAVALIALTLVAFFPGMQGGFIWDDDITLLNNPLVKLKLGEAISYIWFSMHPTDYYPITWSTFWIEWRLWRDDPAGYQIVNILLHALSAVVLWRILLRLRLPCAWLAALIFAVHPVCVESVVWISQRKNTLSMIFYLLTILSYLRFEDSGKKGSYILSVFLFGAGLLSKSSIITLPAILLCLTWYRAGALGRRDVLRTLPFFALSLGGAIMTMWFQGKVLGYYDRVNYDAGKTILKSLTSGTESREGTLGRVLGAGKIFWFYFFKILIPTHVTMVYERWVVNPQRFADYLPTALLTASFVAAWSWRQKIGRGIFSGLAYLVIALFPVLGFLQMSYHYYSWVANHLCYIAVPGVVALATGVGAHLLTTGRAASLPAGLRAAVPIAVIALFAVQTWNRAKLYRDPEDLWRDNVGKVPTSHAAANELGIVLLTKAANKRDGVTFEDAKEVFEKSIALQPRFSKPHNNLGSVYTYMGEDEKAIAEFEKALELNPYDADSMGNLGLSYYRNKQYEKAIETYKRTLELRLMSPNTFHNLGLAYAAIGREVDAIKFLKRACEMAPNSTHFWSELGRQSYAFKMFRESLDAYLRAIQINPNLADSLNTAAWILATNVDPALRNGERALSMVLHAEATVGEKKEIGLLITKAAALAELGRFEDAVAALEEARAVASEQGKSGLLSRIAADMQIYRNGMPYREGGVPPEGPNPDPAASP